MPSTQADLSGVLNPKRVIERRLAEAETVAPAPAPAASSPRFGRKWTPAEQAAQKRQLADLLRARDASR